ncbi:hypothetical protein CCP3SC15_1920002 [Gammaproteobacteria bacterium]
MSDVDINGGHELSGDLPSLDRMLSAARAEGYERCAKDVEENTVKMIVQGVERGYAEGYKAGEREGAVKALDKVQEIIDKIFTNCIAGEDDINVVQCELDMLMDTYEKGSDGNDNK